MYTVAGQHFEKMTYLKCSIQSPFSVNRICEVEHGVHDHVLDTSVSPFSSAFVSWKNIPSVRFIISEFPSNVTDCSDFHSASRDSSVRRFDKNLLPETDIQLFLFRVSQQCWLTLNWNTTIIIIIILGGTVV